VAVVVALSLIVAAAGVGALAGRLLSPQPAQPGQPAVGKGLAHTPIEQGPLPPAAEAKRQLTVLVGGDILLDLAPGRILQEEGPTALMRGWVALRFRGDVDLGLANLECPLSARGEPLPGKRFVFRGDPALGGHALSYNGVDGVSLANNHVLDYGRQALLDTFDALRRSRVAWAGAGQDERAAYAPAIFDCSGVRVALLAFADLAPVTPAYHDLWRATQDQPGIAPIAPRDKVLSAIRDAAEDADIVIASFHWGYEYQEAALGQQSLGRAAIDAGAHLVFGHHPHVPQAVEVHRGRPILYSLGNLVFHPFQPRARDMMAGIVRFELGDDGWRPTRLELHPLYNDGGRTVAPSPQRVDEFLPKVAAMSRTFGVRLHRVGDHLALLLE
jgi:poly-gamma-glutamate synthesis protein (capsule biosynthesis protein)